MIDLHRGEKILLIQRRHWFAIAVEAVALGGLALFPVIGMFVGLMVEGSREFFVTHLATLIFFTASWMLLLWGVFFILWTNYYLNAMVVTNVRVIDVQQNSLFSREVSDVRLANVQDVKVEVHGIIATWLKFGDVHVQSAGSSREIVSHKKNKPYGLRTTILKAQHEKMGHRYGFLDDPPAHQQHPGQQANHHPQQPHSAQGQHHTQNHPTQNNGHPGQQANHHPQQHPQPHHPAQHNQKHPHKNQNGDLK